MDLDKIYYNFLKKSMVNIDCRRTTSCSKYLFIFKSNITYSLLVKGRFYDHIKNLDSTIESRFNLYISRDEGSQAPALISTLLQTSPSIRLVFFAKDMTGYSQELSISLVFYVLIILISNLVFFY